VSEPLRVLIVDDEPLARAGIRDLVARDPGFEVVGECGDGPSAIDAIRGLAPDLVLLDIQMPEPNGFGVIDAIGPERMPPVVFVTAFDQFALRAFDVHALDYLLKPFDDERFQAALDRVKHRSADQLNEVSRRLVALLAEQSSQPGTGRLERVVVKKPHHTVLVPIEAIDWVEAADYCVKIHAQGQVHVIRESMQRMEERLDPARFFRAHRSGIVNLDRLKEIQPTPQGEHVLILLGGARIRLSRARRAALEERLGQTL
jgi:two-component system, LytTR family, response regulator